MIVLEKHIVPTGNYHIRIQEYAGSVFKKLQSRSAVKKCIAKKGLYINGQPAQTSDWIKEGQLIELVATESQLKKVFQLNLEVIYEDDHLALVNKPAGFPTNGNYFKTIENALPFNLKESTLKDALNHPTPVHRLDNPTSGILMIAKTKATQIHLHQQFEQKEIQKNYHAVVVGKLPKQGMIEFPIDGQTALTGYKTIQQVPALQNGYLSLVELHPKTGRTHQLRIHLSELGFPIVGDKQYAPDNVMMHKGLFLCASAIEFTHPISKENICFNISLPNKFNSYLNREHKRFTKHS
ncbi:RluA family pseudouridine synthase [Pseudofulvibacter geojedonensis]|uniref:RluA family pseudouridine synthase n=1 Tax=Pseudofulvibacter geojedonensis TaxID=1123758 RepID=A0ABW3I0W0_9FLAO